jgi:hypothetical protein
MITESDLDGFYCTDNYFSHWAKKLCYTDGVKYLADKAGAYWLIDAIASYQNDAKITKNSMLRNMQFWKLEVVDGKGVLTCVEDSGRKPVIRQEIEFTDFPLSEVEIWVERGSVDGVTETLVAMLKSEH